MNARVVNGFTLAVVLIALITMVFVPAVQAQEDGTDATATVLWAGAYDKALTEVLNGTTEGKWVFADPTPVPAGSTIKTWYGSINLPSEKGWVFFIDDVPMENWAHPCRYVFVDYSGSVSVYNAHGPPYNLAEWKRLGLCQDNLIAQYEPGVQDFRCVIAGDRIMYWRQRMVDNSVVEGDFVFYSFNRSTHALLTKDEHWSSDTIPDHVSPSVTPTSSSQPRLSVSPTSSTTQRTVLPTTKEVSPLPNHAPEPGSRTMSQEIPGFEGVVCITAVFGVLVHFRRRA
jgi:hypothetical protein